MECSRQGRGFKFLSNRSFSICIVCFKGEMKAVSSDKKNSNDNDNIISLGNP